MVQDWAGRPSDVAVASHDDFDGWDPVNLRRWIDPLGGPWLNTGGPITMAKKLNCQRITKFCLTATGSGRGPIAPRLMI